jgi:hypothetical protein
MKGLGAAAGKNRTNNFVLEPFLSAAARSGPPKSTPPRANVEGRSPLREKRRQEESTRSSPARELIPKVRIIQGCGSGSALVLEAEYGSVLFLEAGSGDV